MAPIPRKILTAIRDILRAEGVAFDELPEWQRITLVSHAEMGSMRRFCDVNGAVLECWRSMCEARGE